MSNNMVVDSYNADNVEVASLSATEFANLIKNNPSYSGGSIRLMSCSTGAVEEGFAQQLAKILGVDVLAPTDTLYVYPDGEMFIGKSGDGIWKLFRP